jgi:predicted ArsR family transcriptional regulator
MAFTFPVPPAPGRASRYVCMTEWNSRFLASTRGLVINALRRGEASVGELAAALDVTDNTVRAHLATLERDGLVRAAGKRPRARKPETLYALTEAAEQFFPKAYHLLLNVLLDVLEDELPPDQKQGLLRAVGRRIAGGQRGVTPGADLRERVEQAAGVLSDLGGLATVEDRPGGFAICGLSCPLAATASHHPEVCSLAESLLTELIGVPVRERCLRRETPRCMFDVGQAV